MRRLAVALFVLVLAAHSRAQDTLSAIAPTDRVFILPTASAIGAGHGFLSDYELFFLYGGVGIGDVVSVTAGTSLIPGLPYSAQLKTGQVKATFLDADGFAMAGGASLSYVTSSNQFVHLFVNASFLADSAWYTVSMFYKASGPDLDSVNAAPYGTFAFSYTGSLGIALGASWPVRNRPDMHIIAELWNHDVSNPRHTALFGGIRIGNEMLSGAFGLAFTPVPFVFPAASFAYKW